MKTFNWNKKMSFGKLFFPKIIFAFLVCLGMVLFTSVEITKATVTDAQCADLGGACRWGSSGCAGSDVPVETCNNDPQNFPWAKAPCCKPQAKANPQPTTPGTGTGASGAGTVVGDFSDEQCKALDGSCNWYFGFCDLTHEKIGLCSGGRACCRFISKDNVEKYGPKGTWSSGVGATSPPSAQPKVADQKTGPITNPISANSISELFLRIMKYFSSIAGALAVLFIIIGGVMYMVSGGNKSIMDKAKNTLVYAIVGLVIVVAAPLFLSDVLMVLKGGGATGMSALSTVALNVLRILLSIVGILGIIGLLNAAVIMFIASGYEDQMKAARKALSYSLISIAIAGGSLVLIQVVIALIKPGL